MKHKESLKEASGSGATKIPFVIPLCPLANPALPCHAARKGCYTWQFRRTVENAIVSAPHGFRLPFHRSPPWRVESVS